MGKKSGIKMDDVCLVIHFNGFVFAEKGRGPFCVKWVTPRILIKSTVLFGIDIISVKRSYNLAIGIE